jgi:hypothetical protein
MCTHKQKAGKKKTDATLPPASVCVSTYRKLTCCTHSFHAGYLACARLLAATVSVSYIPTCPTVPLNGSPKLLGLQGLKTRTAAYACQTDRKMDSPLEFVAPLQLRPDRRNSGKGHWNESEDLLLMQLVRDNQGKNWKQVAEHFVGRTDVQCLHRWQKVTPISINFYTSCFCGLI